MATQIHPMWKIFFWGCTGLLLLSACVKPKIYRAEVATRQKCEARESVLVKELNDRKTETAKLTEMVAALNRTIGNQEATMSDLRSELASRTQQMGESSSKLITEKMALEKELALVKAQLDNRVAMVQKIKSAQNERKLQLDNLKSALNKAFDKVDGAVVNLDGELVSVTLNDKFLFDASGVAIAGTGKNLLVALANFLSVHPELEVDMVANTDNALPKDNKVLKDTWEWSMVRATVIVRTLARDYNINANQMTPVARGEFFPLSSNETPEGRQKNRRTTVVFKPKLTKVPNAE